MAPVDLLRGAGAMGDVALDEARKREHRERWGLSATPSRLAPVLETARRIQGHLPSVMPVFARRITNALAGGFDSKMQAIETTAGTSRDRGRLRTTIALHCGGLALAPATHGMSG